MNPGNADAGLDRDHIVTVCLATVPATPRVGTTPAITPGAASGPVAGPAAGGTSDEPRLTLAYEDLTQCRRASDALNRCGYATTTGRMSNGLYGIQVAGWSTGKLERRGTYLREAAADLGTNAALRATVTRAIEIAAGQPPDADPRTAGYHVAIEATEQMARNVVEEAGPLASLTVFPSDPHLCDLLRSVQRRVDQMATIIGDHFTVAGITADTYLDTRLHTRHEHASRTTGSPAQAADLAARRDAWARASAFIADPFDANALVEAGAWAEERHPGADPATAADFAFSYARDCHGLDRADWPALDTAYQAWNEPPAARRLAGADFPHPPETIATTEPEPAQNPAIPRPGRGPRRS